MGGVVIRAISASRRCLPRTGYRESEQATRMGRKKTNDSDVAAMKSRIIEAAESLFRDVGYAKTTVADIARALGMSPELPNVSYGVLVLNTADTAARDRVRSRIEAYVAKGGLPEARVRVTTLFLGPPVGYPVQFRVIGSDPLKVRDIAYQVRDRVRANKKTYDVNLDWNEQARAIRLVVDQDRARVLGLTPQDIAEALQMWLSGVTVTQIRDGIELVDVVARAVPEERLRPELLADLTISTRNGQPIPLSQVAKIQYSYEEPILWRQSRDLTITVRAEVIRGVQAPDVTMSRFWRKSASNSPGVTPLAERMLS